MVIKMEEISKALRILQEGGLVVAPSDTVYGLLVDASNEEAVRKLVAFKNRPLGKSISIFVSDLDMARKYLEIGDKQDPILKELIPGPFTVVLPSKHKTSRILESEKGTLGIRIPQYPFITELVKRYGKPVTATSANLAGRSPHYSLGSFLNELSQSKRRLVDLYIDGGKLPHNKPSTVIDLTTPQVKIIRQGDITFSENNHYITDSPVQTRKIAQYIFEKTLSPNKPTVYILEGELGSGKTMFVKGAAERLGITNIISPTFIISYEYDIRKHPFLNKLHHFDLYNIEDPEEFKHLGIEKSLQKGAVLFIEWGEKSGTILPYIAKNAEIVHINLEYTGKTTRTISVGVAES